MNAFLDIVNEHLLDSPDTLVRVEGLSLVRHGRGELFRASEIWAGRLVDEPSPWGFTSSGEVLELQVPNAVAGALCACVEVRRVLSDGSSEDITRDAVTFIQPS
jgi:hypothetical protein